MADRNPLSHWNDGPDRRKLGDCYNCGAVRWKPYRDSLGCYILCQECGRWERMPAWYEKSHVVTSFPILDRRECRKKQAK
jgi:hypothetical protein